MLWALAVCILFEGNWFLLFVFISLWLGNVHTVFFVSSRISLARYYPLLVCSVAFCWQGACFGSPLSFFGEENHTSFDGVTKVEGVGEFGCGEDSFWRGLGYLWILEVGRRGESE